MALAAAYLVVVQALFAGLGMGLHAAPAAFAPGLAVFCAAGSFSGGSPEQPDPAGGHSLPACCVLGCTSAAPALPPEPVGLPLPVAAMSVAAVPVPPESVPVSPRRSPRLTRGPPRLA